MALSIQYLLDTNILVHYVRDSPLWIQIRDKYEPLMIEPRPLISVVTEGELHSLALQWNWGAKKLEKVDFCLDYFRTATIHDSSIIRVYATLDAHCALSGQSLGKNDLWIAATASAIGATLLTTDRDFDRLTPQFLSREWIDPNTDSA